MPVARFSPKARVELKGIRRYIAKDNKQAARKLIDDIEKACFLLAEFPYNGRQRDELLENMRSFPFGNYVIFYDVIPEGVEILHVIHGAQDFPAIFKDS